jgi:ABC-type bacteriocin/lantibiotic exporter with double-glycine peptidase domain
VVAAIFILSGLNPVIIAVCAAAGVINFILYNYIQKYDKKNVWDALSTWWRPNQYVNRLSQDFEYGKDIRVYGIKDWIIGKFLKLHDSRLQKSKLHTKLWAIRNIVDVLVGLVANAVIVYILINSVIKGDISVSDFVLYFGVINTFMQNLTDLLNELTQAMNCSRQINDFRTFLEYPIDDVQDDRIAVPDMKNFEFEFKNVGFQYPGSDKWALKNMNVKLEAGKRLAVVGLNGAGKSTFIKLLCGLYKPTEGEILLNGVDIQTYRTADYFKIFSPVFQDIEVFAFSAGENISMQNIPETDFEFAEECMKNAGLGNKLLELDDGINTQLLKVLHEEGTDLSGGEKQKLALARAIYKNAPVVILDEPTSALDAVAEQDLYRSFDKLFGGKTSVYISHRLSSTQFCDNVAMFESGAMVEYGTHASLTEKGGKYAEMFAVQAQYYRENREDGDLPINTIGEVAVDV